MPIPFVITENEGLSLISASSIVRILPLRSSSEVITDIGTGLSFNLRGVPVAVTTTSSRSDDEMGNSSLFSAADE